MSELKICRICLRTEAKVYHFNQYQLKSYYEEVMALKVDEMDGLPHHFCYECATMLHKFHKFKEKCYVGQKIFKELLWKGTITYESVYKIDRKDKMLKSSLTRISDNSHIKTYIIKSYKEHDIEKETKMELDSYSETSSIDNDDNITEDVYKQNVTKDNINLITLNKENNCTTVDEEMVVNDNEKIKLKNHKASKRKNKINEIKESIDKEDLGKIDDNDIDQKDSDIVNEEKLENDKEKMKFDEESDEYVLSPTAVYVQSKNMISNDCEEINEKRKSMKTSMKANVLRNNKHWKITILSEEDALKEFRAKADSKKYLDAAFKCTDCFKGFSKKDMLNRHVQLRHVEQLGKYECRFCRYRYRQECYRKRHVKQHYFRYKCLRCGLLCPLENTALLHEEYHSGITRKCKYCDEEFRHSSTYYTHLRTHRSEHVCTLCGASFVSSLGLHQHKQIKHVITEIESPDDDEEVNTYCKRCDILFETRKAYEEHLFHSALHSDEEGRKDDKRDYERSMSPEKVSACKKLLSKREQAKITKELRRRKNDDDPFSSNIPRKRYKKKERRQRTKPTTCHQCGKHFETQAACLKHHMEAHPRTSFCPPNQRYICEICGSSLAPGSIATHQNMHTREKLHTCDTCGKQFHAIIGLKRHLVTHTGEKPFACPLCDKRFTQSNSMKLHYKTFHLKQPYPKRNRQRKTEPKGSVEAENSDSEGSSDESLHDAEQPHGPGIEPVVGAIQQRAEDTMHYLTLT